MKKFVILLSVLFAFQFVLKAQTNMDTDQVLFNVHLLETFDIAVVNGNVQTITFAVPADYNNGVTAGAGIEQGFSTVSVNATGNWDIIMAADNFGPLGGATGSIPIDNLGFWLQSTGTYVFGSQVTRPLNNDAPENSVAMPLTTGPTTVVIGNGTGNAGSGTENTFVFNWEMGTMRTNAAGVMNPNTMFSQLIAGAFSLGDFTTTATLTLRKL